MKYNFTLSEINMALPNTLPKNINSAILSSDKQSFIGTKTTELKSEYV